MNEIDSSDAWVSCTTVGDLLVRGGARWPDKPAVKFSGHGRTYAELRRDVHQLARSLLAVGIRPGDHVGLFLPNSLAFVQAFFAVAQIGAVSVPINLRFQGQELRYVIRDSDAVCLIVGGPTNDGFNASDRLKTALADVITDDSDGRLSSSEFPLLKLAIDLTGDTPGYMSRQALDTRSGEVRPERVSTLASQVRLRDHSTILYTSGTSSRPKGCILTHESLVRTAIEAGRRFSVSEHSRVWDPLPMFHCGGITPMCMTFYWGGLFLPMTRFDATTAVEIIRNERATHIWPVFETIIKELLDHPGFTGDAVESVEWAAALAATEPMLRDLQAALPNAIQTAGYGMTELSGIGAYNMLDDDLDDRITSVGFPLRGSQVRIADLADPTRDVPPGEVGEICWRGYSLFEGYYKDAERTREVFDEHGWFHSGDIGRVDPTGRLYFLGRIKDMLKIGGENVAAAEIESYLETHPDVRICQVVGIPDPRLGEVAVAFVERIAGSALEAEDLIRYCQGQIASFKIPRHIEFVTEWPMSATKIQKESLRARAKELVK